MANSDHPSLWDVAQQFGTPCYVYDFDQIAARVAAVRTAFEGQFRISYAVKSNPNGHILRRMRGVVDLLDISSGGELRRGIDAGWDARLLSFTGPAKRDGELQAAVEKRIGHVIVESPHEANRLSEFARLQGITQPVLLRIAPAKVPAGFGSRMAGRPSQFGIDEEDIHPAIDALKCLANLDLQGFHIYSGTQCLSAEAIAQNYQYCFDLFRQLAQAHDLFPRVLIVGSGMGVPYHENDKPLDLARVAAATLGPLAQLRDNPRFKNAEFVLETGRYLVGEAGVYLTEVISAKHSRGADIRICDGGLNHHLAATGNLGSVLHRNYRMFKVTSDPQDASATQPYDIYGPLCTSIDQLGRAVMFPPLDIGDIIGLRCSGAYGVTSSPIHFISHDPPREVLIETVGQKRLAVDVSPFAG